MEGARARVVRVDRDRREAAADHSVVLTRTRRRIRCVHTYRARPRLRRLRSAGDSLRGLGWRFVPERAPTSAVA